MRCLSKTGTIFEYDGDGLLTQVGAMTLTPDPEHGLLAQTILGDVADDREWDDFGQLDLYSASVGVNLVLSVDYVRDGLGRIKSKTESVLDGPPVETHYKYDPAGRLFRVCADDACAAIQAEYQYDLNSNRNLGFTSAGAISASYDDQDRLEWYTVGTSTTSYTYTANGELETKTEGSDITGYSYDALGNLRHVDLPNGTQIDYVIDGRNRRVGKKVNGAVVQAFLYEDQLRPVAELDASGNVISRFVYGDKVNVPEYMVKSGSTYRIITDHLGSPRLVIDSDTGVVAQTLTYDEWGNVLTDSNPGFQPFGFAGGIFDHQTDLTRFGARDYDAHIGRWTAKDPTDFGGGDPNLMSYASTDPINMADPDGEAAVGERSIVDGAVGEQIVYLTAKRSVGRIRQTIYLAVEKAAKRGKGGKAICYIGRSGNILDRAARHGERFEVIWDAGISVADGHIAIFEQIALNEMARLGIPVTNLREEVKLLVGSPARTIATSRGLDWGKTESLLRFIDWAKKFCGNT